MYHVADRRISDTEHCVTYICTVIENDMRPNISLALLTEVLYYVVYNVELDRPIFLILDSSLQNGGQ